MAIVQDSDVGDTHPMGHHGKDDDLLLEDDVQSSVLFYAMFCQCGQLFHNFGVITVCNLLGAIE